MFLSLALSCLLQNPAFHWDQEVDQSYWQALHLLEVENDPIGAVEILESLVDEPTVIQYRGQASIVMAQTYRALLRGGRKEEAEQLLPLIRRESLRTEYEARAEEIIAEADSFQNPEGELDEEFLDLVLSQIIYPSNRIEDVLGLANAYGDRLTPYLIHYVDPNGKANVQPAAFRVAIATSNTRVIHEFSSHLETIGGQLLLRVIEDVPPIGRLNEDARKVYSSFLIRVLRSGRLLPVKTVLRELAVLSSEDKGAEEEFARILNDNESAILPLLVELIAKREVTLNPRTIVGRITASDDAISKSLRRSCYQSGNPEVISQLALRGDRNARLTLAASLLEQNVRQTTYSLNGYQVPYFPGPCMENWRGSINWVDPTWVRGFLIDEFKLKAQYYERWQFLIHELLAEDDPHLRELSFLVACRFGDWEFAELALKRIPPHDKLPAILHRLPKGWAKYLVPSISSEPLGKLAAVHVMSDEVLLDVEQMQLLLQPELIVFIESYWRSILKVDGGAERLSQLLLRDVQEPYLSTLINVVFDNDEENFLMYIRLAIEKFTELDWRRINFTNCMHDYGSALVREFRASGSLGEDNLKCLQRLLEQFLDGKIGGIGSGDRLLSNLGNQIGPIVAESSELEEVILAVLTSETRSAGMVMHLPEALIFSQKAMEVVVARYPSTIHKGNKMTVFHHLGLGSHILIDHPDPNVSSYALRNFGTSGIARDIAVSKKNRLIEYLGSPLRAAAAARILVNHGLHEEAEFIDKLIAAWQMPDLESRYELMSVVARVYDPKLIVIISDGLENPSKKVAEKAKEAFDFYEMVRRSRQTLEVWKRSGQSGKPSEFLIEKLSSDQQDVRIAAIESLGTMGAIEALPFLVGLMEDADQEVAAAAAAAVKKINGRQGDMEEE